MRAERGLLAGTGTSVSLIAAAAVVLSVLSGVIAFVGWPGADDASGAPPLTLAGPAARETALPAPTRPSPSRPILLSAPPAPSGSARAKVLDRPAQDRRRDRRRGRTPSASAADDTSSGLEQREAPSGRAPRPSSVRSTGGTLRDVTMLGVEVTRTATRVAGEAVAPVAPAAAQTTRDAGRVAGDVAQQVGDTVGRALDGSGGR